MDSVTMFAVWSHFIPLFLESSTSTVFARHLRKHDINLVNLEQCKYYVIYSYTILLDK